MRVLRLIARSLSALLLVAALVAGGVLAAERVAAPLPALNAHLAVAADWIPAPGTAPAIVAPTGSIAVDAVIGDSVTHLAAGDAAAVRPIASVTKTMTALVVLETHPLPPTGGDGPELTMTQRDVDDYNTIAASGGSFAPVTLGERISERDLLLGLMLPSANNMALTLARWVAGSVAGFVGMLNARAEALGMTHTHFADPDGLDPATTSTAADLVRLGEAAVGNGALVAIASTTSAKLPDGSVVDNLDQLLGVEPGWIGIKTGWTPAAGGCLLFAARRTPAPGMTALTVVGAVLGQDPDGSVDSDHPELGGAFSVAKTAVEQGFASYAVVRVGPTTIPASGRYFAPWGASSTIALRGGDRLLLAHLGDAYSVADVSQAVEVPAAAGQPVGSVTVSFRGEVVGSWQLIIAHALQPPTPWWLLLHG